jgi:hypothetical protein
MAEEHNDAAKRMSDAVNLAAVNGSSGKWMAFKLSDGSTDHTVYDSRSSAVSHVSWPEHNCFIQVDPNGMQLKEAEAVLGYWRQLHDAGGRFRDPGFHMPFQPLLKSDQVNQIRILTRRK